MFAAANSCLSLTVCCEGGRGEEANDIVACKYV